MSTLSSLQRAAVASLLLHVGAVSGAAAWARYTPAHPAESIMVAKLVRLGPAKPKDQLPDRPTQAPPPPEPAPAPTPAAPAAAAATPASVPPDASKRAIRDALKRLKKRSQGTSEGSPEGDADEAEVGDRYTGEIYRCLKANYVMQGVEATQVAGRRALVLLFVQADGRISRHRVLETSGLPAFDQAVSRAVQQCAKQAPPPEALALRLRREGLQIDFSP